MIDIKKSAISMKIRYEDSDLFFAANPYAAACLDAQGKLIDDRYFVYFAYTLSPNNEVRFIIGDDGSECFKIDLAKLPSTVDQILICVIGLIWHHSNLICEASDNQGEIVSRIVIDSEKIKEVEAFAVARLFRSNPWKLEMKVQVITDSELQALIEGGGYNELYNPPSDDKVCCEESPFAKDSEQSIKITAENYNQQWADIMDDIDDYYDRLDALAEVCGEIEEMIAKFGKINWSKVGDEKRDDLFSQIQEFLDIAISRKNAMGAQFHRFCDSMEEIIFSLLSYKKQNKYCEEKIERLIVEKFSKYKVFVEIMKERFGFERSEEQKARRTERLKQLE